MKKKILLTSLMSLICFTIACDDSPLEQISTDHTTEMKQEAKVTNDAAQVSPIYKIDLGLMVSANNCVTTQHEFQIVVNDKYFYHINGNQFGYTIPVDYKTGDEYRVSLLTEGYDEMISPACPVLNHFTCYINTDGIVYMNEVVGMIQNKNLNFTIECSNSL
jgi:hypothetical protein